MTINCIAWTKNAWICAALCQSCAQNAAQVTTIAASSNIYRQLKKKNVYWEGSVCNHVLFSCIFHNHNNKVCSNMHKRWPGSFFNTAQVTKKCITFPLPFVKKIPQWQNLRRYFSTHRLVLQSWTRKVMRHKLSPLTRTSFPFNCSHVRWFFSHLHCPKLHEQYIFSWPPNSHRLHILQLHLVTESKHQGVCYPKQSASSTYTVTYLINDGNKIVPF